MMPGAFHVLAAWGDESTKWVAIAIGLASIAYLVLRPMRRKKDPLESGGTPSRLPLGQQRLVEQQMSGLLVELSDMARQISAQLDTRATKLELLIREADEKIAALKAAGASTNLAAGSNGSHAGGSSEPATAAGVPIAAALPVAPVRQEAAAVAASAIVEPDPRHLAVYALADQGRSLRDIAQELGRPSGEIELILALRPRK